MNQIFVDLAFEDPAAMLLIDRFLAIQLKKTERELNEIGDRVEFMWLGEDLGTQRSPMISMDMFQSIILPRHRPFIELAKSYDMPVMIHTCGSSSWTYNSYIEAGITVFDTLQPEAVDMSPEYLARATKAIMSSKEPTIRAETNKTTLNRGRILKDRPKSF